MTESIASRPVVVLGFGTAGISAVQALREAGYDGTIVAVSDAEPLPYSPVLTSYYAGGRIARDQCFIWSESDIAHLEVEMHTHTRAVAIDVAAHEIMLDDGCRIGYSKLLISTGAQPIAPGFPQADFYHPLVLRTMEDAERLRLALTSPHCRKVLVSGTSMVGLKVLEACLDRDVHVTLLGRSQHILRASAHPIVAERFEGLLSERGVALRLAQMATAISSDPRNQSAGASEACNGGNSTSGEGTVFGGCNVTFSDGDTEHFDEVVLAHGVRPNLDFVGEGLQVDRGLVVDQFMRTSAPDVFAAGDVAQALDVSTGARRIIGLWQNAVQQGRCAGRTMAAELAGRTPAWPYPGSIACNTIHVRDIVFASVGSVEEGQNRCYEMRETDNALHVLVYETSGSERRLVGANTLSVVLAKGGSDSLDCEIGKFRREILNSYIQ